MLASIFASHQETPNGNEIVMGFGESELTGKLTKDKMEELVNLLTELKGEDKLVKSPDKDGPGTS